MDAVGDIVGDQGRDADAEVDQHPVAEFAGDAPRDDDLRVHGSAPRDDIVDEGAGVTTWSGAITPTGTTCSAQTMTVRAPYWTDLDAQNGLRVALATFTSGEKYEIVQWNTFIFGTTQARTFQVWIGLNGVQEIAYAYTDATLGAGAPTDPGLTVGRRTPDGSAGAQLPGPPLAQLPDPVHRSAPRGLAGLQVHRQGQVGRQRNGEDDDEVRPRRRHDDREDQDQDHLSTQGGRP